MLKSVAKCLPHPLLMRLYHAYYLRREDARARDAARWLRLPRLGALNFDRLKTSDTIFILGSGPSINEIAEQRWSVIARHDSLGFNFWPVHAFVPRIFVFESLSYETEVQQPMAKVFRELIERRSEAYADTIKILTELLPVGHQQTAMDLPEAFREKLYVGYTLPAVARTERELAAAMDYLNRHGEFQPSGHLRWLFKYGGSVIAMLSLAVRMNYKRIVLCGIDLGRQEYFYQDRKRYPESADWEFAPRGDIHLTARRLPWMVPAPQVIHEFQRRILAPAGIELLVENRNSKLFPEVREAPASLFKQLAQT